MSLKGIVKLLDSKKPNKKNTNWKGLKNDRLYFTTKDKYTETDFKFPWLVFEMFHKSSMFSTEIYPDIHFGVIPPDLAPIILLMSVEVIAYNISSLIWEDKLHFHSTGVKPQWKHVTIAQQHLIYQKKNNKNHSSLHSWKQWNWIS